MFFDIVASGSKGNATLIFTKKNLFLVDMGITISCLEDELNKFNKNFKDITAVFVTHNHTDHIKNIKAFSPKKLYALENTIPGKLSNVLTLEKEVYFGSDCIIPFQTSHDAINPCGYLFKCDGQKLVYMTDTGVYLDKNNALLKNPNYLIIESNHDIQMLMKSARPMILKQRILGDHGHLCNEDSAFACKEIMGDKTEEIVLAHISEECNTPELALEAYKRIFDFCHIDISSIKLRCANQWTSLIGGDYEN